MKKVLIISNREKWEAQQLGQAMGEWLTQKGLRVVNWEPEHITNQKVPLDCDLALVLGGDGTMLYAAGLLYGSGIPLLGVNLGNIGFITSTIKERWKEALESWLEDHFSLSQRIMLEVSVWRNKERVFHHHALNEGVVAAHGLAKIVFFEVNLSGVGFGDYRSDGILVSTPTGSTAYSLSAGGPIVHPEAEVFVLTPICPHSLTQRPIVIPSSERITVKIGSQQRTEVGLTVDGRTFTEIRPNDEIHFIRAELKTKLIQPEARSFYELVREKLS